MHMKKIREIAKKVNVAPGAMERDELIRAIQEKEGNTPCFQSGRTLCQQYDCWWRTDCKPGEMKSMNLYSAS